MVPASVMAGAPVAAQLRVLWPVPVSSATLSLGEDGAELAGVCDGPASLFTVHGALRVVCVCVCL